MLIKKIALNLQLSRKFYNLTISCTHSFLIRKGCFKLFLLVHYTLLLN